MSEPNEEVTKWEIIDQTVKEVRQSFADLSEAEIHNIIDEAVVWARKKRWDNV
jgi:Ribbon-helix-helix domain